jgi:hypothetical protein
MLPKNTRPAEVSELASTFLQYFGKRDDDSIAPYLRAMAPNNYHDGQLFTAIIEIVDQTDNTILQVYGAYSDPDEALYRGQKYVENFLHFAPGFYKSIRCATALAWDDLPIPDQVMFLTPAELEALKNTLTE